MDNFGPKQETSFDTNDDETQSNSHASLEQTYDSVKALFDSKVAKLITSKQLVVAEAKMSLSALLLSFAISLCLVVIVSVIWILLNGAVGLLVYTLMPNVASVIGILLVLNGTLAVGLFYQLTRVWRLVGFSASLSELKRSK